MAINAGIRGLIRKLAVKNAIDYGSARDGPILAKMLSKDPSLKSEIKSVNAAIKEILAEVNSLSKAELEKEYNKHSAEFEQEAARKAEKSSMHNFSIQGAEQGNFVTRFPPEPGGYMHIGHAKPLFVEDELRKVYGGELLLYFDDTNPDNERQEFVDAFKEDLEWLGVQFEREYYASDNIARLYEYANVAIRRGKAYVCRCDGERIKQYRMEGKDCEHKKQGMEENIARWNDMLEGRFSDNEAILRFSSDMGAANTTLRDPTLFRIKHASHYRQGKKYFIWPTYDFCTPILDSTNGITDVVRSKEYELRDELYFAVLDALGLRKPRITSFSRLEISNNVTSKRKIRELIAEGKISGWDDPRLVTIRALRKRGITAEAIKQFSLGFGLGKAESVVDIEMLLNINRRIVDPIAKRLFFIEDPKPMHIEGIEGRIVEMKLNFQPDSGYRKYKLGGDLFINASDSNRLQKGDTVRLKDAFNVTIKGVGEKIEATYQGDAQAEIPRIQWIPKDGAMECELVHIGNLLEGESLNGKSMTSTKGYAEAYASVLKAGDLVQFERRGLFKLDSRKAMSFLSM